MVDLLELYYHPSNDDKWTSSLTYFLYYLCFYFIKRITNEEETKKKDGGTYKEEQFLTPLNRKDFVRSLIQLIEWGQYSKNGDLSRLSSSVASKLAFVEPSLVLPLITSCFYTAMENITATHQLESALKTLAWAARSILQVLSREDSLISADRTVGYEGLVSGSISMNVNKTVLLDALFKTLPGLDANDHPKLVATVQLYLSIIYCVRELDNCDVLCPKVLNIDWSLWIDKFLSHHFGLLVNLEPSYQPLDADPDYGPTAESGYFSPSFLRLLFGKMSPPLYEQALNKVVKFVHGNMLPGNVDAIVDICSAAVHANPSIAFQQLLEPIMQLLITALGEFPSTGFSGSGKRTVSAGSKVCLSSAQVRATTYQLDILAKPLELGGAIVPLYSELLDRLIDATFDVPSTEINGAGAALLSSVLQMIFYYPLSPFRSSLDQMDSNMLEDWISSKGGSIMDMDCGLVWHIPNSDEIRLANYLLEKHLRGSLATINTICADGYRSEYHGQEKDHFRVLLLRIHSCLSLGTCISDFKHPLPCKRGELSPLTIAGAIGPIVGSPELRTEVAEVVHKFSSYLLKHHADNSYLLSLLVKVMGIAGNYGSVEKAILNACEKIVLKEYWTFKEPGVNIITNTSNGKHRPRWLLFQRAYIHNLWRASQAGSQPYYEGQDTLPVPTEILTLSEDLLKLSLHNYSDVRTDAAHWLLEMLERYPSLCQKYLHCLTSILQDPKASEEMICGSCTLLMSDSIIQCLQQDLNDLSSFLVALLGSAHHKSYKAQKAIHKLFSKFIGVFGGVCAPVFCSRESDICMRYNKIISHIKDLLIGGNIDIHWRYNLMAHIILLFLALPLPTSDTNFEVKKCKLKDTITGLFLGNLRSEFPALPPLSVLALMLLLKSSSVEKSTMSSNSLAKENDMIAVLQQCGFGDGIVEKLAIHNQYLEEENWYIPQNMHEMGLSFIPGNMREFPYTRTWESIGVGNLFSPVYAKLFERLIQEFGCTILESLRGPLEEALCEHEDESRQCISIEIIAGLLHSDAACVVQAWNEWLQPLLDKALLQPALQSTSEWPACARFAVTGKGRSGKQVPILRYKIMKCLAKPLPRNSATTLVTRRWTTLPVALVEIFPTSCSEDEIILQEDLLNEAMDSMTHLSPQVGEGIGKTLCILCSNLYLSNSSRAIATTNTMCKRLVEKATLVAVQIHKNEDKQSTGTDSLIESSKDPIESSKRNDARRCMGTILHFFKGTIRSGRAKSLMNAIVGLIYPIFSLQGIHNNDLSDLAKFAIRDLQWQPFVDQSLSDAVSAVLSAANASNWHTRVAALEFMPLFLHRHRFIMLSFDMSSLWEKVQQLLTDNQLEVREVAASTLVSMMKGAEDKFAKPFRETITNAARSYLQTGPSASHRRREDIVKVHGIVLGLSACILSRPYDIPGWLPDMVIDISKFIREPMPTKHTITRTIREFQRTHADTWEIQKKQFTEEQLDVLNNFNSGFSYFA